MRSRSVAPSRACAHFTCGDRGVTESELWGAAIDASGGIYVSNYVVHVSSLGFVNKSVMFLLGHCDAIYM